METAVLIAPITALEFFLEHYLLKGEGPILTVFNLQSRSKATASIAVLQHYRIHGVRPKYQDQEPQQNHEAGKENETNVYDLAVFGGKGVRLVRLIPELRCGDRLRLEAHGPLIELQDWILDVRWLAQDGRALLGVALAHNGVLLLDPREGSTLARRRCLDGCLLYSALLVVDASWGDSVLVGGTVFNQLVLWRPEGTAGESGGDPEGGAPVERRLLGHGGVIFSIHYLRGEGWLASASDDRSVRVWAVGALGGPGRPCGHPDPACLMVLYGHQARVFSVHLCPGMVFSAGEDGCCLVWDGSRGGGGRLVRTLKGHRAGGVRALAVSRRRDGDGARARWVATGGADGGVRLWRVDDTKVDDDDGEEEGEEEEREAVHAKAAAETLTDLKFRGHGAPKGVCVVDDGTADWARVTVLACTDQGAVYQHRGAALGGQWDLLWQGGPAHRSYCVMEVLAVREQGTSRQAPLCAVGNLSGGIYVFPVSHPGRGLPLSAGDGKVHSLVWAAGRTPHEGYLLASGASGLVRRWRIEVRSAWGSGPALVAEPCPPFVLPPCAKRWLTAAVHCHRGGGGGPEGALWVCGDRRGSLLLFEDGGRREPCSGGDEESRSGEDGEGENGTNCCDDDEAVVRPLSCLFGVHGKQGVTSVCEHQGLFYSAGRDGCVRVSRVRVSEGDAGPQLEVLRVQRACKGMEWLERVLILGPAEHATAGTLECEKRDEEEPGVETGKMKAAGESAGGEMPGERRDGRESRFVIAGFHAVHFVVWDPVKQERLLAVPCGGGHRSWSLWPPCQSTWPGYGALVFIKQGAVVASQPPTEASNSAGAAGEAGARGLREGLHGKGIGCVCRLGRIGDAGDGPQPAPGTGTDGGHWEVLATGGEDTSLTVLAVRPSTGAVRVLCVITDHISNVRTLASSVDPAGGTGERSLLSALLVSAGGRAQMQCYRLLIGWDKARREPYCQVIQVAGHRLDEHWENRRNRHKTVKTDPETRYMSIAVVNRDAATAVVALACSDGAVRLFSISEVKGQIDLLWESFYHQRCVLSVAPCCLLDEAGNSYTLLLSAATDGRIAFWDVTSTSLLADGVSDTAAPPAPCLSVPAHQSGVNSLAVWQERTEDGCLVTVASGGDDGQLTLSVLKVRHPGVQAGGSGALVLLSQSRVPLAHSAPVTGLGLLSRGFLVSTSPDQRVTLWRVRGTGLRHTAALYSHVADAAGLAVWGAEADGDKAGRTGWVVVCGQGLQLLRVVTAPCREDR